jgi:ribosomal protein L37AE/L43A
MQSGIQSVELELKYCERCGTLGTRRQGSSQVYCESCEKKMAKVYRARPAHRAKDAVKERDEPQEDRPEKKPCQSVVPPFTAINGEFLDGEGWL